MIKRRELRIASDDLRIDKRRVHGIAAVYDSPTDMGDFMEVVRHGAFESLDRDSRNIQAFYHHNEMQLLGTTKAKTLRLYEKDDGLRFSLDIPETSYGDDLLTLIKRGDVAGCSFGFIVQRENWVDEGDKTLRELLAVSLLEITLTHNPAYQDTSVALRTKPQLWTQHPALANAKRWLETC